MVLTTSPGLMIVFALSKRLAWELNLIIKDAKLCVADAMTTVGCAFWDTPSSCSLAVGVDVRCYYVYNSRNDIIQVFLQSQTGLNNITMSCQGHRYCLCASVGWVYVLERRQGLWRIPPLHTSCSGSVVFLDVGSLHRIRQRWGCVLLTSSGHQSSSSGCCGVVLVTCVLSSPRTSELELFNENVKKPRCKHVTEALSSGLWTDSFLFQAQHTYLFITEIFLKPVQCQTLISDTFQQPKHSSWYVCETETPCCHCVIVQTYSKL